jgi:uncharacterized protein YxjI
MQLQRDRSGEQTRYLVYDEGGTMCGRISGRISPSGELMELSDCAGNILCRVRRLGFHTLSAYRIRTDTETVRLQAAVSGGVAMVRFRGISFSVRGDVMSGCYDIIDADQSLVCSAAKNYGKGAIRLEIYQQERGCLCVAAAACIDSLTLDRTPALQMT